MGTAASSAPAEQNLSFRLANASAVLANNPMLPCMCSSWSIGQEHTSAQRKAFEKELHKVENAFQKFGGQFLTGSSVSLVSNWAESSYLTEQHPFRRHARWNVHKDA